MEIKFLKFNLILLLGIVLLLGGIANAQHADQAISAPPPPPPPLHETGQFMAIERMRSGILRIGAIKISKSDRTITFPAKVNMKKGLLEYLLVKSTGKTHESLLSTEIDPYYLNIAFLLLGYEGTDTPLPEQGANVKPEGDLLKIELTVGDKKKRQSISPLKWIVIKQDEKFMTPSLQWIYTGSVVFNGQLMSQAEGSIIALFHDPAALIDNNNPSGSNDEVWFVNETAVPDVGTQVIVTISPLRK